MVEENQTREVFLGKEFKIIEIGKVAKDRHYLVLPLGDKLPEGMDAQFSFFQNIVSNHLEEVKREVQKDFEGRFGRVTGFRIGVNFGSAGFEKTPHLHMFPLIEGEKIKPRLTEQTIERK